MPARLPPGFQVVHMMDCRNPNEIIVGEIESWRVQKLVLQPTAAKPRVTEARAIGDTYEISDSSSTVVALIAEFRPTRRRTHRKLSSIPCPTLCSFLRDSTWAKWAAWRRIRAAIFSSTRGPGIRRSTIGTARPFAHGGSRLFEFDRNGNFVREIGKDIYGFMFAAQVRVDPAITSGWWIR